MRDGGHLAGVLPAVRAGENAHQPFCRGLQNRSVDRLPQYWTSEALKLSAVQIVMSLGAGRSSLTAFRVAITRFALCRFALVVAGRPVAQPQLRSRGFLGDAILPTLHDWCAGWLH